VIAVSTSSARLTNQFFFLLCKLYLSPFSSKVISLLEKVMLVLFDSGVKCVLSLVLLFVLRLVCLVYCLGSYI
jgi:hypothetical protein